MAVRWRRNGKEDYDLSVKGFRIYVFPCRFWSRDVSRDSLRVEGKMTGIHWRNFVFLCLTDLLIIFSLNTLAFVHRSLDFRGILKNQNLLGFEVLAYFPGAYSPAVPTHWALWSTGNEGFRVVFKFCSAYFLVVSPGTTYLISVLPLFYS